MEPLSTLFEGERNFVSGTNSSEEAEFMSHLFGHFSTKLPNVTTFPDSSAFWPHHESVDGTSLSISDNTNTNIPFWFQEDSYPESNSLLFPTSSGESYLSISCSSASRKCSSVAPFISVAEQSAEHSNLSRNSRKQSCSEADVHTSWKKLKLSKSQKECRQIANIHELDNETNGLQDASPKPKGVAMLKTNGKKRASSGSAIDSQSVYAKKRREKINERLRILQNLVPNGTKVDISTMLEEAVQYVKFLQLQIKLLSSNDLWMYAPIAYNGMDLGLDEKLPSPR